MPPCGPEERRSVESRSRRTSWLHDQQTSRPPITEGGGPRVRWVHVDGSARDSLIYKSLVERTPDFIVVFDDEGVIQFANEGAKGLLGYDPDHLIGRSVLEFIHPNDHDRALQSIAL